MIDGSAFYPTRPRIPQQLKIDVAGFVVVLTEVRLTARDATATVRVQLPGGLADRGTCGLATLDVGEVPLTPDCLLSVDAPEAAFGPWLLGDTGLTLAGTGYTLDLTTSGGTPLQPPAWQGVVLHSGRASGVDLVPEPANTGYLRGDYSFTDATVTSAGLAAHLTLDAPHRYDALAPLGYRVTLESAHLDVFSSTITGGQLGPGTVQLPVRAACAGAAGDAISVGFTALQIAGDLDTAGVVDCADGLPLTWGELTNAGAEQLVWDVEAAQGFLYLPAGPLPSYAPTTAVGFTDLALSSQPDASIATLEANGMTGVALRDLSALRIHSPDRPHGATNPLDVQQLDGWLRVGHCGVDGTLSTLTRLPGEQLGEPARPGYVGHTPITVDVFGQDKVSLIAEYAASAAYDSAMNGTLRLPEPCHVDLEVAEQRLTSTASLVGGHVALPPDGAELEYWQLKLVGAPGVLSTRTGRVIFTAAGIDEPVHFAQPFWLTWGELLADGNVGELLFNHNNHGQRFDHIPFVAQQVGLSPYVPGRTDGYLAVCGNVHFDFFGPRLVNLRDARHLVEAAPYHRRYVTSPKVGETGCPGTDLHLAKDWDDKTGADLAVFDFPDAVMDYFEKHQDGFIGGLTDTGKGTCTLAPLGPAPLEATVEIHHDAIDVRLSSETVHPLDLAYVRIGSVGSISACVRIEGPLLTRISLYSLLEQSVTTGTGIIEPRAGYAVEVNVTTTPNTVDLIASGNMMLQVAGAAVELSATAHLLHDFDRDSSEGEVVGRVDCSTVLGGIEGDGQVTWFVGQHMQYLQGRLKVFLCSFIAEGAMEGGLFLGHSVPKALAWVARTDSPHFGVSDEMLSDTLTGVFGYGRIAFGFDYFVFGGGIELYAALGAFDATPPGQTSDWCPRWPAVPGLPYVIGACGIHLHGEILGGLVSASAWAELQLRGPAPYFEGSIGLEGCVLWVICASIDVTAGFNADGFYIG